MSPLIGSEVLRISSRRMVRMLALLALVGITIGVTIGAVKSQRPDAAQLAVARSRYERELRRCLSGRLVPADQLPSGVTLPDFCTANIRPQNFENGNQLRLSALPDIFKGSAFVLIVIGLVIGASSVGADWQHGTMATLLTWEPRRIRVLLTRVAVVTGTVMLLALALLAVLGLAIAAAAAVRGSTEGADGAWLRQSAGAALRIGAAAVVGSALGLAIATIGRNTAAALGAVFVYLAVAESLLRSLVPRLAPAMLSTNVVVFVDGRPGSPGTSSTISVAHAALAMAVYAIALLCVALGFFRARDVT